MLLKTLALVLGCVVASSCEKFYRHDYIYNEEHDAFYKLLRGDSSRAWDEAFISCEDEGAQLFYPEDEDEWIGAANLTNSETDVEEIFVGIRDEFGLGDFASVEGRFLPEFARYDTIREGTESKCVVMALHTGAYSVGSCKHRRAFICKKLNRSCPTIDSAYIYSTAAKKCYKVHDRPKIWSDALHTCFMEGGILATLTENIKSTLLDKFIDYQQVYFIGVRRILPQHSFYNLQGSIFEIAPEGNNQNDERNCKVILRRNTDEYNNPQKFEINSYDCNTTLPFICEMQVKV